MQHLFGSEIPALVSHFREHIRAKYQVNLVVEEKTNEQGEPVYHVFLPQNAPHFEAIVQECDDVLQTWLAQQNAQAWQNGASPVKVRRGSASNDAQPHSAISLPAYLQQRKITVIVTALCAVIYLGMLFGFAEPIVLFSHFPDESDQYGEIWRYFSHTLVHLSNMHILFNLIWWWIFGGAIERRLGSFKLLQIYFLAGAVSGIAQNMVSGPAFFGLSGVVYAVLGYVFVLDKLNKKMDFDVPEGFFNMLVVGILLGFAGPLVDINIGNTAHISGLLVGVLLAFADRNIRVKS
ncbi:rhomboid family intramembrane serine protease [Aggregatibacter actinomycetemcomitans]|uniref:rhomboid family intramembrane serine protease n=1 Tax=Aggregatibacter actinomycetemcomitans TaxID=714 RepID=UPI0002400658|nr:rhomboid family intramembrane serine protease [Aggregatibacter actinomycetemcomitans]EHK90066.1 GlpG protein [Aggregatibacter actinomycetemcomitans RhAA1]KNE77145.1 GlpG protein [Aggregatibacter actinomycetemcomitans RhAA1]